jgi:two-component system cell cycle sensor histidine kinase PleC
LPPAPALGGAVVAVTARPSAGSALGLKQLAWLAAPAVLTILIGALLLVQGRKIARAQQAFLESEQRFRLAAEAARCGVWEWDLSTDQIFMSEVTAAIFGLDEGGWFLARRSWTAWPPNTGTGYGRRFSTAAIYGVFDVSFRTPAPQGGRAAWIDARGHAFGEPAEDGYSRIIGVALDVTEERMAQARGPGRRGPPARRDRELLGRFRALGPQRAAAAVQPELPQLLLARRTRPEARHHARSGGPPGPGGDPPAGPELGRAAGGA